jgi:hypothetical protein
MIKKRNLLEGEREGVHEANLKPVKGFVPSPVAPSVRSVFRAFRALQAWWTEVPCLQEKNQVKQ